MVDMITEEDMGEWIMNNRNNGLCEERHGSNLTASVRCASLASLALVLVALMILPAMALTQATVSSANVAASDSYVISASAHPTTRSVAATDSAPHPTIPNLVVGHSPGTNPAAFGVLHHAKFLGVSQPPRLAHPGPTAQRAASVSRGVGPLGYLNGTVGMNGLDNNPPNNCGCTPPDTSGSTGAGFVFETVNTAGQIWSTAGKNLSTFNLNTFFQTAESLSDPNVHYDPMSGRWFAEIISVTNYGNVFLAVSTSNDPTGTWNVYMVNMPNHTGKTGDLPDQVNVGVSANTISLSGNDFAGGGGFAGAVVFVVNKSQAVAGTAPAYVIAGPWASFASVHAAEALSSTGTIYFLSTNFKTTTTLNYLTLTGAPPSAYQFTFTNFTTSSTKPGTGTTPSHTKVITNDNRMGSAVWFKGVLWGAANDGTCSGGSASCAHLWEVNTTTQTKTQDFIWTPAGGLSAFYPAVTLDSNMNLGMLYSFSGTTAYPSVGITGEAATDTPGTMETPTTAKAGVAQGSAGTRFGDYSGASTDMSNNMMWGFGEWTGKYGCTGNKCYEWDTWVQSFNFTVALSSVPTITSFTANPPTISLGATSYLNVTATGGTTPYAYSYSGLPAGCASSNTASLKCVPTATGSFNISVTVTDAKGKTATAITLLTVNPVSVPTITSFTASPNPVTVNTTTVFSVAVSGGTTPYSYVYTGLPTGCSTSNANTLACISTVTGTYNVTVTVTDANSKTATKTTALTVVPVLTVSSFSASPNPVPVNTPTAFSVAVAGGISPYSYAYTGLPTGCATSNTNSLSCTPTVTGSFNVTVRVTDSSAKTATKNTTLIVNAISVPTITSFTVSPNPVTVNATTTFNATVAGGTLPYSYAYTGLPAGCLSSSTSSLSCTPTASGNYTVSLTVTDKNGKTAVKNTTLSVIPALGVVSFAATPNPVTVNTATTFSVAVSGGTKPYSYSYTGLPAGCSTSNTNTISCTPTAIGTFNVRVNVTDFNGNTANRTTALTVNPVPSPTITSFSASPNPVTVNAATTFSTVVSGGTTPYSYAYAGLPSGCSTFNTNSLSCIPTAAGTSNVTVTVTDANGKTAAKNTTLTVIPALVVSAFAASPNPVSVNAATTFSVTVSGGTAPYSYAYTGLPTGCSTSNTNALSCTPTAAGTANVTVTVTDAKGTTASKPVILTVISVPTPSITSFTANPARISLGGSSYLNVTVTGGTTPYVYSYSSLPAGCTSTNTANLKCTPTAVGNSTVVVTVTDANSKTATSSAVLRVVSAPTAPVIKSFTATPSNVTVNTSTTLAVVVQGGTPPYAYVYTSLPAGCATFNANTISCTPAKVGTYNVTVTVTDSNHLSATQTLVLNVVTPTQPGPSPGLLGVSNTDWFWLLVVAVVASTIIVGALMRKRRSRPSPPPESRESSAAQPMASSTGSAPAPSAQQPAPSTPDVPAEPAPSPPPPEPQGTSPPQDTATPSSPSQEAKPPYLE